MSAGIYLIGFNSTEDVYIGHSSIITDRWSRHSRELSKNIHHSKKLQNYYNSVDNNPFYEILVEIPSYQDRLIEEAKWIAEFNSYNQGFNMTAGGEFGGSGYTHTAAKYTKEQYVEVFKLLAYTNLKLQQIATESNVSLSVVSNISSGRRHSWLHSEYDLEWELITNKVRKTLSEDRSNVIAAFIHIAKNPSFIRSEVADLFSISKKQLEHILYGTGYTWLKDMYPAEYAVLQRRIKRYNK